MWGETQLAFEHLSEAERLVLAYRLEGYTLDQIATIFDRSRQTIKQRESRAWAILYKKRESARNKWLREMTYKMRPILK